MRNQRIRTSRVLWIWCCFTLTVSVCLGISPNNAHAAPTITSPAPGTTLTGSTETFSWTAGGSVVTEWWLYVGTNPGERDVYNSGSLGTATSDTVSVLPTNGATLHVRLWFRVDGEWKGTNFIYTAFASDGSGGGLSAVPPWDQVLPATERFVLVMSGEAVLDKETGLVFEQQSGPPGNTAVGWKDGKLKCNASTTGGRRGWRLPSIHELLSLIDPENPTGNPDLPSGHPFDFSLAGETVYLSATVDGDNPDNVWEVDFFSTEVKSREKSAPRSYLCVRGAGNLAVY